MDFPRFCRSELVQDRGSRPNGALSKFLDVSRSERCTKATGAGVYLRKRFLDIAVDGIPHLGDHIGRLRGNLNPISTTGAFAYKYALGLPRNPSTSW